MLFALVLQIVSV